MKLSQIRKWKYLAILVVAGVIFGGYSLHQRSHLLKLYQIALYSGSDESSAAIQELGADSGDYSKELLLRIIFKPPAFTETQVVAIDALAERGDPQMMARLASLLQPHEALDVRRAVSQALQKNYCTSECVHSILHYQERLWRGERNWEDAIPASPLDPIGSAKIQDEQKEVQRELNAALVRDEGSTLKVLADTYGLGTGPLSPFGLYVVDTLNLHDACPALQKSSKDYSNGSLKQRIQEAMQHLQCASYVPPH